MNQIPLAALLGALALSAGAQTPDTVRIPAATPRFALPEHPYHMSETELYTFKGIYDLSNGKILSLFSRGFALYAEVGDEGRHRLVPTAAGSFVAADRQLKLALDEHDDGTITGTLTMVIPATQVGGVTTGEQLLVATFR